MEARGRGQAQQARPHEGSRSSRSSQAAPVGVEAAPRRRHRPCLGPEPAINAGYKHRETVNWAASLCCGEGCSFACR